ncbi:MAG: hypothetical protein R6X29_01035 [Acidimicrobiia bacterium]
MAGFVCLYYGNTGSSWLVETLSTSPEVLVTGFEPVEQWAWDAPAGDKLAWMREALTPPVGQSDEAFEAWGERLAASPQFDSTFGKHGISLTGFKMTWGAVDDPEGIIRVIDETGSKAISLVRENRVKHALSLYRYHEEQKSQFEQKGVRPPSRVPYEVMVRWLEESSRLHEEALGFAERCESVLGPGRVARVAYEEFVTSEGKEATIRRLAGFLGIDQEGIRRSRFEKATPDDLREALDNYLEMRLRFALTPHRRDFR